MNRIPLSEPIILYISNVDMKILTATALSQGYTLNKMISEIVKQWCNSQVSSRKPDHVK